MAIERVRGDLHDRFRYLIHFSIFLLLRSIKSKSRKSRKSRIYDDYVEDEMEKILASIKIALVFFFPLLHFLQKGINTHQERNK